MLGGKETMTDFGSFFGLALMLCIFKIKIVRMSLLFTKFAGNIV
jgi:hypothetical protein